MITNEVIVAYMQCKLKSYLLLFSGKKYIPHEYISILKQESTKNKTNHLSSLNIKHQKPITFSPEDIKKSPQILIEVSLIFDDLKTHADVLTTASNGAPQRKSGYEPTIVIGTNKISKDQKTELAFVGYVLSKIQRESPVSGTIVRCKNKPSVIKLGVLYLEIDRALGDLSNWIKDSKPKPPDIILNKNCSYCQFRKECEAKAIEKDDLSLLGRVTIKDRRKYHKKGIFTINQLSYLFKPRKQRIGKKKTRNILRYQLELQALAIRTNNIYVQELPQLIKHKVEIFLDIEGVPDQEFYYLIGLLICDGDKVNYHSFWADTLNE